MENVIEDLIAKIEKLKAKQALYETNLSFIINTLNHTPKNNEFPLLDGYKWSYRIHSTTALFNSDVFITDATKTKSSFLQFKLLFKNFGNGLSDVFISQYKLCKHGKSDDPFQYKLNSMFHAEMRADDSIIVRNGDNDTKHNDKVYVIMQNMLFRINEQYRFKNLVPENAFEPENVYNNVSRLQLNLLNLLLHAFTMLESSSNLQSSMMAYNNSLASNLGFLASATLNKHLSNLIEFEPKPSFTTPLQY
jgi:hypothetical protein